MLLDMVGMGSLIARAVNALPIAVVSFLLMRKFVFYGTLDSKQSRHTDQGA
jgi:hypothetical protein